MSAQVLALDEEDGTSCCAGPLSVAELRKPVEVRELGESGHAGEDAFWLWPFLGPLLFDNTTSDARDHCANERTFLSYLRLSVYMAIVSVAIVLSFHLKHEPSEVERRIAKPMGAVFWVLSVACLFLGLGNYIKTVNKYSRRAAIVQTGWKTQAIIFMVALCIIGTCVVLLVVTKVASKEGGDS